MVGVDAVPERPLLDVWSALSDVAADLEPATVLNRVVAAATQVCGAGVGVIDVVDPEVEEHLGAFAAVGTGPVEHPSGRDLLVELMQRPTPLSTGYRFVGVPVSIDGSSAANLYLLDPPPGREFTARDEDLAGVFAAAAGAVLTAVLRGARDVEAQRQAAVLEDRDRISRDLHDVVIQRLYAVGLGLDQIDGAVDDEQVQEVLSNAIDGIDQSIDDLRRTIAALGDAATLGPDDLLSEVSELVEDAGRLMQVDPELTVTGPVRTHLDAETRSNLVAVVRELLSNAVQHAEPSRLQVGIAVGADVVLTVTDDGRGFEPGPDDSGNGLRNIVRRAELLGGDCEVRSAPGEGTSIVWSAPVSVRKGDLER